MKPPTTMTYASQKAQYLRYLAPSLGSRSGKEEEIRTTPLFSLAVKHAVDHNASSDDDDDDDTNDSSDESSSDESVEASSRKQPGSSASTRATPVLPQYSLLGFNVGSTAGLGHNEPIMLNMNAPNSAFICGSQGSGKSYTLSCMLENCLLPDPQTGNVEQPVAGVVFHYDVDTSGSVAEAATLCSRGIKVNVLVSESNFYALNKKYAKLPGANKFLTVQKLKVNSNDLSVERMHKLMAFSEKGGSVPLYMETIQRILRQMAITAQGGAFNYARFKALLAAEKSLSKDQTSPMTLRLDLLESFMHPASTSPFDSTTNTQSNLFTLHPGTLTVLDLTDPFIDPATVCVLFDICLSLAKEKRPAAGLVVALDEAHKYMEKESSAAINFTNRLLTTIREQRHNAVRVIIATQEPTISERLLDLCSVTIVHGFKSPAWFQVIRGHLGGASVLVGKTEEEHGEGDGGMGLFERIVKLQVGESLVFSPGAFVRLGKDGRVGKLGTGVMKMLTRKRAGVDAGCSVLASEQVGTDARTEKPLVELSFGGNTSGLEAGLGKIKFF